MYKIMFVCHGNICRSPMAEFIMKKTCVRCRPEQQLHYRLKRYKYGGTGESGISSGTVGAGKAWDWLFRKNGSTAPEVRL